MNKEKNINELQNMTLKQWEEEIDNNSMELQVDIDTDKKSKDELEEKTAKDIIVSFANKYNTDVKTALIVITKFVQDGGSNSSRPNMSRKIGEITFELSDLRQSIRLHDKFGTVRKLAKTIRKIIAYIAKVNKWQGPLCKDIQRLNPVLVMSEEDMVYCAEFNSDNYDPDMPPRIREALQQREQKIREIRSKFEFMKSSKINRGKRKRGRSKNFR